MILIKNWVSCF